MLAEADVAAVAEGEDARRAARDVEAVGLGELVLVAVRRAVEEQHALPFAQALAAQLDVPADLAREELGRHLVAEDLGERVPDLVGVRDEMRALRGVARELQHAAREDLRQRLRAADDERHQVAGHLVVVVRLAVEGLREVDVEDVVARADALATPQRDRALQVLVQLEGRGHRRGRHALDARLAREEARDEAREHRAVLGREADQPARDGDRDLPREVGDDVHAPRRQHLRQARAHLRAHVAFELRDGARREVAGQRLAQRRVVRRVHHEDGAPARIVALEDRRLLVADVLERGAGLVEVLAVLARAPHVLEARQRPRVEPLDVVHGALGAQPRVDRERVVAHDLGERVVLERLGHRLPSRAFA